MKLLRYGPRGSERPGLLDADGRVRDLSGRVADLAGDVLSNASLDRLRTLDPESLPLVEADPRIGPCVGHVPKMICVGLNFADHAAETGMAAPAEPILFAKATSAINGPNDDVMLPAGSMKSDWEVELGVVIGERSRHVAEADALDRVAGYCVVNDISEREAQLEGTGQWIKGKSFDTFAPVGPWLVTRDEAPDPRDLDMFLDLNGARRQTGNTRTMIFGVASLISYISRHMTLEPGDILATGTPPGVGHGFKPPVYLNAGDEMRLGVRGLGEQRQRVVPFSP